MLLKDKFIFIVEDNTQNRVVFQMSLVLTGARVEFERWGRDAVLRLETLNQVDLIILDLMLHNGVSGYDIFDQIRKLQKFDHIPIVAVSASEPAVALPKTQQKGFSGFISKPIDDTLFPKQIAQLIAGEKIWYAGERYHG
jgi:two-component system, chemotaxis family, sensor kinase CheA